MNTTKLSQKYQIVVPKAVREMMKLKAGMSVALYPLDESRAVIVKQAKDSVKMLRGLGKEVWQDVDTDVYLSNLKKEWRR